MKTRRYRNYYARRRAPHSLSSFYLRAKLIPLAPKLLSALAVGAASAMGFLPTDIRSRLRIRCDRGMGSKWEASASCPSNASKWL